MIVAASPSGLVQAPGVGGATDSYTVVLVTHNLQQAARVSDMTAFMYIGEVVEFGNTRGVFENPRSELTENYITGKFG